MNDLLQEMDDISTRIVCMIDDAKHANSRNEVRGILCGMQDALQDLAIISAYITRRRQP